MGRRDPGRPLCLAIAALAIVLVGACENPASSAIPTSPAQPVIQLLGRRMLTPRTETREITFGGGTRVHLIDGWSVDEWSQEDQLSFVWATAPESTLWFQILQVEDQQVLVKLRAFGTTPQQTVTVLVNDREIAHLTPTTIFLEYRFVIPAAAIHPGKNRMTFRHGALGKPADADPASRSLAAAYASLLMGPQCLPLRGFGPSPPPHVEVVGDRLTGPLLVVGPAELHHTLQVPPHATLRYQLALPSPEKAPVLTRVRVVDAQGDHGVFERTLTRGFLRRSARHAVSVDLSPWSGKTIDLVIDILPEPCRYATTTAVLEQAGIF